MKSSTGLYLSRIDHLRFLAAMIVLWFHFFPIFREFIPYSYVPSFPLLSLLQEGHTGVSLFLVLSGFIFTRICYGGDIIYKRFIINRILRIAPLGLFWAVLYFYMITNIDPVAFVAGILTTIARTRTTIPGVGWTLIVEYQFYLMFPFLLLFIRRWGNGYAIGLVLLMICVRTFSYFTYGSVQFLAAFTIFGRLDQFLLGMLAAVLVIRAPALTTRYAPVFLVVGLTIAVAAVHSLKLIGGMTEVPEYASQSPYWIIFSPLEGIGYAGFIIGYVCLRWGFPRWIDRPLAALGAISYSIYWGHVPIYDALGNSGLLFNLVTDTTTLFWTFFLLALPLVLLVSKATYELIERPFLELRSPYMRPASEPSP